MCLLQHVQFIDNINHVLELVVNKNKFELIDAYQSNRHWVATDTELFLMFYVKMKSSKLTVEP